MARWSAARVRSSSQSWSRGRSVSSASRISSTRVADRDEATTGQRAGTLLFPAVRSLTVSGVETNGHPLAPTMHQQAAGRRASAVIKAGVHVLGRGLQRTGDASAGAVAREGELVGITVLPAATRATDSRGRAADGPLDASSTASSRAARRRTRYAPRLQHDAAHLVVAQRPDQDDRADGERRPGRGRSTGRGSRGAGRVRPATGRHSADRQWARRPVGRRRAGCEQLLRLVNDDDVAGRGPGPGEWAGVTCSTRHDALRGSEPPRRAGTSPAPTKTTCRCHWVR